MSTICTSNLTSGFIDLATYDEQEKYMYGGPDATAYFVRETRKSTWFTQVPVVLSRASGIPEFGSEWSASVSRAGDYLLQTWLRVTIPSVRLASGSAYLTSGYRIRWTNNLMHALIKECCITFNDLVAARFDNYHLDFWSAFTVPAGKRNAYNNMVGNQLEGFNGQGGVVLPSFVLNLPLPFFYTRDSGVALPTAAIPYNDMRISFSFRNWWELLQLIPKTAVGQSAQLCAVQANDSSVVVTGTTSTAPSIQGTTQVWANYAIVSNDERKRMACAPRDILIEQVQTAPVSTWNPGTTSQPSYDIRFSHAIKALFFAARNTSLYGCWSNYTSESPTVNDSGVVFESGVVDKPSSAAASALVFDDPIANASLVYENTQRLYQMGVDYFSLVNPWYHAPVIPLDTGYHCYSYSLDFYSLDPMGSTNYGKLMNVSIIPAASANAVANNQRATTSSTATTPAYAVKQTYEFVVTAVNNNIVRISGGALGFPVL